MAMIESASEPTGVLLLDLCVKFELIEKDKSRSRVESKGAN